MATDSEGIRVAARAIIIAAGQLLVQHYEHEGFRWCVTPGGGIDKGETLIDGLKREVKEELSIDIEVGNFAYVRELRAITRERIFGNLSDDFHQVEHFFFCPSYQGEVKIGEHTDDCALDFGWIPLDRRALADANFFPQPLRERLPQDYVEGFSRGAIYLGDV
ncbi:MAG: NUDIX domain-containing protein [Planctomycetes bacterium]|nr:NUDIX domain-containing protein [Planctomycetota bacterium]